MTSSKKKKNAQKPQTKQATLPFSNKEPEAKLKQGKRHTSDVWQRFSSTTSRPSEAKCSLCEVWIKRTDGNTTGMKKHRCPHQNAPSASELCVNQKRVFEDAIAEFVISDYRPISVVSSPGFRNMIKTIHGTYEPPSRQTIDRRVTALCVNMESKLKGLIRLRKWITLTVDGWSDKSKHSYVMATAHWSENFILQRCVLAVNPLRTRHTAINLRASVTDVLNRLEFRGQIFAKVHDNASNIVCNEPKRPSM